MQQVDRGVSRRAVGLVAAAVVGLVGLGVVVDSGSPDADPAAAASTTTTERATSTTRRTTTTSSPSTTTTTLPAGPVLQPGVEGILVLGTSGGSWTWVDLATGERGELVLRTVDLWSVVAVRGGIVVLDAGDAVLYPVPRGEAVTLGTASQVLPASDTSVWLLDDQGASSTVFARLVNLSGSVVATVEVPQPYVNGSTADGLVFWAGGRVYSVDAGRGVRPLGEGEIWGVGRAGVVVRTCSDQAVCSLHRIDSSGGQSVRLDAEGDGFGGEATVAADGRVALSTYYEGPSAIRLFGSDGSALGEVVDVSVQGWPVWLPGDGGLLLPTVEGLLHVGSGRDGVTSELVPALDGLRMEAIYLVTR